MGGMDFYFVEVFEVHLVQFVRSIRVANEDSNLIRCFSTDAVSRRDQLDVRDQGGSAEACVSVCYRGVKQEGHPGV